jgi:hypothetical protein
VETLLRQFLAEAASHRTAVVVSTRPYGLAGEIEGLQTVEIAPLTLEQMDQFLRHYYADDRLIEVLGGELRLRPEVQELARVPFFLSVLAGLYFEEGTLPRSRLDLYQRLCWELADRLDVEHAGERFRVDDPHGHRREAFLQRLALHGLLEASPPRLLFDQDDLQKQAQEFCQTRCRNIEPFDLVDDVERTAFLHEVAWEQFAFAHLTLQEYLAARELAAREDGRERLCQAYFNGAVRNLEVLPMALGLSPDPAGWYAALRGQPESWDRSNLLLRLRGLAYAALPAEEVEALGEEVAVWILASEEPWLSERLPHLPADSARAPGLTEPLRHLLRDAEELVRSSAAAALGQLEPAAATEPVLMPSLPRDAEELVRHSSVEALQVLIGLLVLPRDAEELVRGSAAALRGRPAAVTEPVLTGLLGLLQDTEGSVRGSAAAALGWLGPAAATEPVLAGLLGLLRDAEGIVRRSAAAALGWLGQRQPRSRF